MIWAAARIKISSGRNANGRRGFCRCPEVLRCFPCHQGREHRDRGWRVRHSRRPFRLRQINLAPDAGGSRKHHRGRNPHRQPGGQPLAAEGPRHRHGVPELCALSAYDGRRQHGLLADAGSETEIRNRQTRRCGGRNSWPFEAAGPLSASAFRRSAPARRHGAGDRARPAGVSLRRTAFQSRCQAARRHARRDQGTAPAAEDHDRLRDA